MTSLPFFIYFFTLFIVGKKCYSIPPLKKCDLDTTSIKDLSFFPQLNTKKGKKLSVERVYSGIISMYRKKQRKKKRIFPCVGELALTRTIPCSKKKQVFLNPWYAGPLGLKRIKNE